MDLVMGLDIGTTSVKVVVLHEADKEKILSSHCRATEAQVVVPAGPMHNEQEINKIITCVDKCIQEIEQDISTEEMSRIRKIAICGQMHGCVFWRGQQFHENCDLNRDLCHASQLITWQDARCDEDFLKSLPVSKQCPLPLSTGFACASILWLQKNKPEFLKEFDCSGTIADYLVARLCKLDKPLISTHNALSWGYFNTKTGNWDYDVMAEANFPAHILPDVASPRTVAGNLNINLHGISSRAEIVVAMGDMQCSVMSCQIKPDEGVLNLSTSAQLSMLVSHSEPCEGSPSLPCPVIRVPYFDDYELVTSASLNGGAVFASFVQMLTQWTKQFTDDVIDDDVYRLLTSGSNSKNVDMKGEQLPTFVPTVFGERHAPDAKAAMTNIGSSPIDFRAIARSICRGILENLRSMCQSEKSFGNIRHLWACGGAFSRNPLFREELVNHVFNHVTVSFSRNADASYGAALSVCS